MEIVQVSEENHHNLVETNESTTSYYEKVVQDLRERLESLEGLKQKFETQALECVEHKAELLKISEKFSYDDRCHQSKYIWHWLKEIAQSRQSQFIYFSDNIGKQTDNELFVGNNNSNNNNNNTKSTNIISYPKEICLPEICYHKINGLFSAVGEANRTGKYVHFKTTISNLDEKSNQHLSFYSETISYLFSPKARMGSNAPLQIDVLCVPNRSILSNSSSTKQLDLGCFIFLKVDDSKVWTGLNDNDCECLELACNLVSRVLVKGANSIHTDDYYELMERYDCSQQQTQILLDIIEYGRSLLGKPLESLQDLNKYIIDSIGRFTHYEAFQKATSQPIALYESNLFINGSNGSEKRLKHCNHIVFDLVAKVKSTQRSCCHGNVLVSPIIIRHNKLFGVVVIEKKLNATMPSSLVGGELDSLTLSNLSISELEEKIFSILLTFISFLVDKVDSMKEVFATIGEASQAVSSMESARLATEERLSIEIAIRLQYEETIKRGQELFGTVATRR